MSLNIDDSEWDFSQSIDELINILHTNIQDKESSVRISAELGLLLIAGLTPSYHDQLLISLKSMLLMDDIYLKGIAALSLGILGSKKENPLPYLDMLKSLLYDEARFVKWNASVGMAFILSVTDSKVRQDILLKELLSSSYWYFRVPGAIALGFFCETTNAATATPVINQLKPMLNDSDIDVRVAAVYGLGFIAQRFNGIFDLTQFFKVCLYDYDPGVVLSAKVVLNLLKFPIMT